MSDELVKRLRGWRGYHQANLSVEAADRIEALTADFARQVQRTDEQREAYEQALSVMEADNERLQSLLAHAASDLTAYVDAEYPPDTCAQYPDIARRHHRDMDLVRRIEAALKGEGNE